MSVFDMTTVNGNLSLKAPITTAADNSLEHFFIVFQRKYGLIFHMNPLPSRGFTQNTKSYFFQR